MKYFLVALALSLVAPSVRAETPSTQILDKLYATANTRLAEGNHRAAAEGFRAVADTVAEMPEANGALALAVALADWTKREEAVAYARRALAVDPANPVATLTAIVADPALSVMRSDGALYLTPWAAERLERARSLLDAQYPGLQGRGRALARFADSAEPTGDTYFPRRFAGFRELSKRASFGAMFVVDVPPTRFAAYDPRIVASLRSSVAILAANHKKLEALRARLGEVRHELAAFERNDRRSRIAVLERTLAEVEASASEREQRLLMLEMSKASGADEVLRRERAWVAELNRSAALQRRRLETVRAGRD